MDTPRKKIRLKNSHRYIIAATDAADATDKADAFPTVPPDLGVRDVWKNPILVTKFLVTHPSFSNLPPPPDPPSLRPPLEPPPAPPPLSR